MARASASRSIDTYADYRSFLNDRFLQLKQAKPKILSHEYVARRIGISKTYLQYVLARKRHLSLDKIAGTARTFALDSFEKQYLTYLLCLQTSKDAEIRNFFSTVLDSLRGQQRLSSPKERALDARQSEAILGSLAMLIHAMANLDAFRPEADWIRPRLLQLKPTDAQIRQVLDGLLQQGLIVERDGRWTTSDAAIQAGLARGHLSVNPTFEDGLRLAEKAVAALDLAKPAFFSLAAYSVTEEVQRKIIDLLVDARKRMSELVLSSPPGDRVVFHVTSHFTAARDTTDPKTAQAAVK